MAKARKKRRPHNGQEYEYRIKSAQEGYERTARESQLGSVNLAPAPSKPAPKPPRRPVKRKEMP
jgi:hypothetical protein